MKHIVAFAFTLLLAGCAGSGASNLNLVSLGMNKIQVQDILGNPDTTSAQAPYEYFMYNLSVNLTGSERGRCAAITLLSAGLGALSCRNDDDFFVRFENGVVESYGRVGDFDSTQVPEATINVNRN
jgi:ABC-type Fe3+-hydroxamate transport system substrate-binding protein